MASLGHNETHKYNFQRLLVKNFNWLGNYSDVIMGTMAPQITSLAIVYSSVYSGADRRKHQSPASLAFLRGIHQGPVKSPHKCPVTLKMFPFDDVIMDWGDTKCMHMKYGELNLQKCHCMIRVVTDIIHTQFISACTISGQNPPIKSRDCIGNFCLNKIHVSCFMCSSIVFYFRREK